MLALCVVVIPVFITAQENGEAEYGDLWVSNHSSYHIRVLIDGWNKGSVWTGATSRITVPIGDHEFYAEEYQNGEVFWGPWDIYVPEDGYELTLCDPEIDTTQYATPFSNLTIINQSAYDVRVFIDGFEKGIVSAGGTLPLTLEGGYNYDIYAEQYPEGEIVWDHNAVYLPDDGGDYTYLLY